MSNLETLEVEKLENEECCPTFHPEKWHGVVFNWNRKPFIKESIPEFFHIPYPPMIAKKVTKMMQLAEDADKLEEDMEDILLLFMDPHPFKSEMYLSVTGEVEGANNTSLTGTFISRVFKGDYSIIPESMKEMDAYLKSQNKKAGKYYVHYAYCPKCAKEHGHNYMVLFAEIED